MTREVINKLKDYTLGKTNTDKVEISVLMLNRIIKALEQESSYNSFNSLVESKLKNPKAKTFDILHFVADNAGLSTFEAIEKAYNMGVSEQESILDKIRAEIEQKIVRRSGLNHTRAERDRNDAFLEVLDIIDKYKSESEKFKDAYRN